MSIDTRDTILQVARRLFVDQGYAATSIRQIAQEAEIGKATVYHHFTDKDAIALALFERAIEQEQTVLETLKAEPNPRRRIETAVGTTLRFLFDSAGLIQIVRREVTGGKPQLQTEYVSFWQVYSALIAEALQEGTKQGQFRAIDPTEGAQVLVAMIMGAFSLVHVGNIQLPPVEQISASILDVYFRGVE